MYRFESEYKKYTKYVDSARYISALLVVMYGLVPLFVEISGVFEAPYANINFWFSFALLVIILKLPINVPISSYSFTFVKNRSFVVTAIIFLFASYVFFLFPWHDDRESLGASLAAFFRALWFVVAISYIDSTERTRLLVIISTVILMYIDQSRTYFLLLLLIIAARSDYKKSAFFLGLTLAIVLGAVRSSDSTGGLDLILYGIIGEGYNATKAVGQIHEVSYIQIDMVSHIASTFLQPITFPFDIVMSKIFAEDYKLQDYYLSEIVISNLGEVFNPMGGWYIVGDFVYYGNAGICLMALYVYMTWYLTRKLLDTK
jgi:hypothetical protein